MDEAIRKLKAGDWEGGLGALNALWAETRCPGLAAEIERLSAHALASRPPLELPDTGPRAAARKALQTAWEKRCAEGALVGLERLLAVIREGTVPDIRARFDRLRERAPDPRVTLLVERFASELHLRSDQARAMWTAFFRLVVHTGDPRARPHLERLAGLAREVLAKSYEPFEDYLVQQVPRVLEKLPAAGAFAGLEQLRAEVDALLAAPFAEVAAPKTPVERLEAQVLERPSDLDAIRVWADALLEAGDDRGTFVTLQLTAEERPLTAKEAKLEARLLKANRLSWLGQAGAILETKTATFRRGLLDSALLKKKARPADLGAPELRPVAQLWAPAPALLGHENLVSLRRLGRCAVPDPRSTTGPVGFDYPGFHCFGWEESLELTRLGLPGITHLETSLPEDLDLTPALRAFPGLRTLLLSGWIRPNIAAFKPVFPLLGGIETVILLDIMDSREADDAFFVDQLPRSDVHFVYGGGEVYRSYLRRDGELHAVFTDTSTKGGFVNDRVDDLQRWLDIRMRFFSRMPAVSSLSFRQRSPWSPQNIEAVARRTAHLKNVTLPVGKKGPS